MTRKTVIHWGRFVWDADKEQSNRMQHGVDFRKALAAFLDPRRVVLNDEKHSWTERRHYCIGRVGEKIVTVRYTHRGEQIRIMGAGHWRKWRKLYEKTNSSY